MHRWSRWLQAPGGLLILLISVVVVPAATLVFLGVRLLQQDRALAGTRRIEILAGAADRAIRALATDLASLKASLSGSSWVSASGPPGAIHVRFTPNAIQVDPSTALAYWPTAPALIEAAVVPFDELDHVELVVGDVPRALEISTQLVRSPDAAVQGGALVRQARVLRKMGRAGDALEVYDKLAQLTGIAINGLPADLQARKTRCVLLLELSRASDFQREASAIEQDLRAGRWRLDRSSYEYASSLVGEWLNRKPDPFDESVAMGAAVEWLYQQWLRRHDAGLKPDGSRFLDGAVPLTVVWTSTDERAAALVAGSAYLKSRWLEKAQEAAGGVQIALAGANETRPVLEAEASEALTIRRTAADTGLPWAVEVSLSGLPEAAEFKLRRQILLAALAAVLMLVAAGTFVIVRSRNREMALAQLQSDFVTAVSHEFRTPLTALRQFNELLIEPSALTAEAQREYHHAQSRATERLHRLVESLLDFGRMEAGKRPYKIEQVDLGLLVRDVIEEFRDELDSRIILHHSIDPGEYAVDADTEALARAIWNLLDNAVKYSGDAREVDVSVTRTGDRVAIAVRDHGIGIPLSDQRRIFQKFTRGTAAMSRSIKGTGIGLAMVQHVVSAHGGTVSVQSVEGQGSTFTIVLPALPASPAEGVGVQSAIERSAIPPASSGAKS